VSFPVTVMVYVPLAVDDETVMVMAEFPLFRLWGENVQVMPLMVLAVRVTVPV